MQKEALFPTPLTSATGNLVDLKKISEMSPIKDEFLLSQNKTFYNFGRKLKKSGFKLSIEGPILLVFVKLSQIIFEGLLVITINKVQSFFYN